MGECSAFISACGVLAGAIAVMAAAIRVLYRDLTKARADLQDTQQARLDDAVENEQTLMDLQKIILTNRYGGEGDED